MMWPRVAPRLDAKGLGFRVLPASEPPSKGSILLELYLTQRFRDKGLGFTPLWFLLVGLLKPPSCTPRGPIL